MSKDCGKIIGECVVIVAVPSLVRPAVTATVISHTSKVLLCEVGYLKLPHFGTKPGARYKEDRFTTSSDGVEEFNVVARLYIWHWCLPIFVAMPDQNARLADVRQ